MESNHGVFVTDILMGRREPTLLITVVHPPNTLLPISADLANLKIINLTETIKGYSTEDSWDNLHERISFTLASSGPRVQLFIDALDVLAEDFTPTRTLQLIRSLLRTIQTLKGLSRMDSNRLRSLTSISTISTRRPPSPHILILPSHSHSKPFIRHDPALTPSPPAPHLPLQILHEIHRALSFASILADTGAVSRAADRRRPGVVRRPRCRNQHGLA